MKKQPCLKRNMRSMTYLCVTPNLLLTVCTVLIYLLLGSSVAQSAVMVEPPNKLFTTKGNASVDQTLTIANPTSQPLNIRVYLADWSYDPSGKPIYVSSLGSLPRSASPWITFNPSELLLGPGETGEVRYSVDVPANVKPGTHWSMVFFEGEKPGSTSANALAAFSVRVGHTIYVNVPPIERSGMITGMFGQAPVDPAKPYRLSVQYANLGNGGQGLEGRIELRDSSGDTVMDIEVPKDIVLPGGTRLIMANLYGPLPAGQYTALAILNYGDDELDIAGDYSFTLKEDLIDRTAEQSEQ